MIQSGSVCFVALLHCLAYNIYTYYGQLISTKVSCISEVNMDRIVTRGCPAGFSLTQPDVEI